MNPQFKIIILALATLASIVVDAQFPRPVRAHSRSHVSPCINNLRQINAAKQQWAEETPDSSIHTLLWSDIRPYLGWGTNGSLPAYPQGGTYTLGKLGEPPKCSIPSHVPE